MISALVPLADVFSGSGTDSEGYTGDDYYVTYHSGTPEVNEAYNEDSAKTEGSSTRTEKTVTVKYDGVAVAEYNPQFWVDSIKGHATPLGLYSNWYSINGKENATGTAKYGYVKDQTYVFTGWKVYDEDKEKQIGDVIDPGDRLDRVNGYEPGDTLHLVATWSTLAVDPKVLSSSNCSETLVPPTGEGSKYTRVALVEGTISFSDSNKDRAKVGGWTIRGVGVNPILKITTGANAPSNAIGNVDCSLFLNGETIIDNIKLEGYDRATGLGDPPSLYACGHKLIIGTGVNGSGDSLRQVQITGGNYGDSFSGADEVQSTSVAIFSGVYSNIVAGSYKTNVGTTDLRIIGGEYIGTIYGGNSGYMGDDGRKVVDSVNVLVVGGKNLVSNGMDWQVVMGGSRGGSHGEAPNEGEETPKEGSVQKARIEITGNAHMKDVQAGGRSGDSWTKDVDVIVSGNAVVSGNVSGGDSDGNDYADHHPVGTARIRICGGATVGSVYGGGLETYREPVGPGVKNASIEIAEKCMVSGSVFGGGIRGTVGSGSGDAVSITISGGTIEGNVYGGGSGSPDIKNKDRSLTGKGYILGNVNVTIHDGTIKGNVYGGGKGVDIVKIFENPNLNAGAKVVFKSLDVKDGDGVPVYLDVATVTGDVSVEVLGGTIEGNVFGAGKGFPKSNVQNTSKWTSELNGKDLSMVASVKGEVTMDISGGIIGGSVYGAGENGKLENGRFGKEESDKTVTKDTFYPSDPKTATINIGPATINGNVYGGGLGSPGVLSTYLTDRTININGATIGGSVYGGSKEGYDNCRDPDLTGTVENLFQETSAYPTCEINIISGNIATGTSGNVYGGGYSGHSYFDSTINIGVPAAEALKVSPSGTISIGSVFGGPNVGVRQTGSSADETVLMIGDVYIDIGGKGGIGQVYNSFTITGDVFGGGDYCKVEGMKKVSFDGFDQGDVKMLSIQKVDDLVITDSHIRLAGNVDGSSAVGSNRMSLNRVGMMTLASVGSRSIVEMDYAARSISGYASTYVSEPEDPRNYNLLRVNNGKTFFILGEDNTGNDGNGRPMGDIRGKTLFESDSNDYFGAFIIGQLSSVKEGTGFWIINDGDVAEARTTDYDRLSNGIDDTRAWFLSGAFSVEKTVLFDNAGNDDTQTLKSGDVDFILPKIVSDSKIRYTGYHLELNSPGSLEIDPNMTDPGSDLKLMFGLPRPNALTFGNGSGLELSEADIGSESSSGGMNLYASVEVGAGFTVSGYAGTVVLHFAEIKDGIALGIFDVRVLVYLRVSQNATEMTVPVIMRPNGSSRYSGTADIYLPALDQNAIGTYKITSVSGLGSGNSLVLNAVSNNLGKDGWLDAYLRPGTEDHKVGTDFKDESIELGTGAVYSSVLRVGYDAGAPGPNGFDEVTMSLAVCDQNGNTKNISVKLLPEKVLVQKVTFMDKVLGNNGVWEEYIDLFTVDVEFGTSISKNYVAYKVSAENNKTDATSFIRSIDGLLLKSTGSDVLVSTSEEVVKEAIGAAGGGYVPITIEDLLNRIIEKKPDTVFSFSEAGDKNTYDYSVNTPSWNNGMLGLSRFNFERPITAGQDVYSAYGVSVILKAVKGGALVDGYISPDIIHPVLDAGSGQVTLDPKKWFVGVKPGYKIEGWYFDQGCTKPLGSERVYSSVVAYAKLELVRYHIEVTVTEESSTSLKTPTVDGLSKDESGQGYYTVESKLSITVDLTDGYHISDVSTNTDLETEFRYTVDGGHVELTPPPAVKDASRKLVVMIDLSQRFIVTITLPDDGHSDNGMFGLTETQNGSLAPTVTENGTEKSISFKVENGGNFVMNAPNGSKISLYGTTLIDSAYQDGITVTEISADTAYRLYVTKDWNVTYGSGYAHTVKHLNDPLASEYTVESGDDRPVRAGDIIKLKLDSGHVFGPSFSCTGAVWDRVSTDPREYKVSGGMEVEFGDAIAKKYIVNVTFTFENAPATVYGSAHVLLGGQLYSVMNSGTYTYQNGTFVSSFGASDQTYTIEAGFFGYKNSSTIVDPAFIADSTSETGVASANVTITLSPADLDVVFIDGSSKLQTYGGWNLLDTTTISQMYGGATDYWMWSTGSYFFGNEETIDLGKFPQKEFYRNDMPLVLYAVPYLKDMTPAEYRESVTVILVTGDLNGQHVLKKAVPETKMGLSLNGYAVTVEMETIGGSSILTIEGCPDGTGALQVITEKLVVLIVSVPEFEDVS